MNNAQRKGLADITKTTAIAILVGFGFQAVFKDQPILAVIALVMFCLGVGYTLYILGGVKDE